MSNGKSDLKVTHGYVAGMQLLNNTILPFNPLLEKYAYENANLFKVHCTATPQITHLVENKDGEMIKSDAKPTKDQLLRLVLIHNQESYTVNHQHTYELDAIGKFIKNIGDSGFVKAASVLAVLAKDAASAEGTKTGEHFRSTMNSVYSIDSAVSYQGSQPLNHTINFTLMAFNDPWTEVILPANYLAFLSYPTIEEPNLMSLIDNVSKNIAKRNSGADGDLSSKEGGESSKEAADTQDGMQKAMQSSVDTINKITGAGNRMKYRIGNAPPKWQIYSNNGLVYLEECHIESVNITYHGPWVSPINSTQATRALEGLVNPSTNGMDYGKIFGNDNVKKSRDAKSLEQFMDDLGGLPSFAEVSITFKNNFSKPFAEDVFSRILGKNSRASGSVQPN